MNTEHTKGIQVLCCTTNGEQRKTGHGRAPKRNSGVNATRDALTATAFRSTYLYGKAITSSRIKIPIPWMKRKETNSTRNCDRLTFATAQSSFCAANALLSSRSRVQVFYPCPTAEALPVGLNDRKGISVVPIILTTPAPKNTLI